MGKILFVPGSQFDFCGGEEKGNTTNITELRQLKSATQEKWGTHDALQEHRPVNEVAKATAGFSLLRFLSDKFPKRS